MRVSIVVPVFNAEQFILDTLKSLAAQTYGDCEFIIVDDGSQDSSAQLIDSYLNEVEAMNPELRRRFQFIRQPNGGQSAALNRGWSIAQGEFLGYLSADDRLHPSALADLMDEFNKTEDVVVRYPDYELIDENGQPFRSVHAPEYSQFDLFVNGVCAPGPGAIFHRKVWASSGGWSTQYRQVPDWHFWMLAAEQGAFKRLPKVLAQFRVHEASASFRAPSFERAEEPVLALAEILRRPSAPLKIEEPVFNLAKAQAHVLSARLHLRARRWLIAFQHLQKATFLAPRIWLGSLAWRRLINGFLRR
ncbi:MAG TPA: glycosyltransferase [Pseudobdellovibrionaceae bacterium]|nr:glycosyltransferase [Pseudobdellovibrionaceae bacterium]